jgi:DNA repair photolyase
MSIPASRLIKGRGALSNADGRFESLQRLECGDGWHREEDEVSVHTSVSKDLSKTAISRNTSPDVPFDQSVNAYRGCEHGCIYCYARPSHSYLGLSPGLDFESKLYYKPEVVEQLKSELGAPGYRCDVLALGTNTDPYQPLEKRFGLTRGILELCLNTRQPVTITTKSGLVERDLDLLTRLAALQLVVVSVSVTTLDHQLARVLEPRAAAPGRRLRVISTLTAAGIPLHLSVAPVIPALTDHELESIMQAGASRGAHFASYTLLRLPWEVKELFREWLRQHFPGKSDHIMSLIRQSRGGRDYDAAFEQRRSGTGPFADLLADRYRLNCSRLGLNKQEMPLDTGKFRPPHGQQTFAF